MQLHKHTHPVALDRYAFIWSEVRLCIAAIALFIGGYPPVLYFLASSSIYSFVMFFLRISWIVSGVTAVYLLYRWFTGGQTLFGHKHKSDLIAFLIMVLSGINLGLVGLIGQNIGMSLASGYAIFVITGIAYVISAYHLYTRWKAHGEKLF